MNSVQIPPAVQAEITHATERHDPQAVINTVEAWLNAATRSLREMHVWFWPEDYAPEQQLAVGLSETYTTDDFREWEGAADLEHATNAIDATVHGLGAGP